MLQSRALEEFEQLLVVALSEVLELVLHVWVSLSVKIQFETFERSDLQNKSTGRSVSRRKT